MTRRFDVVTASEFQDLVEAYPFRRKISEVHLHHTWRPRQSDYRGLATIEGMWRFHTETNGWSDIAQHVTVAPDGAIWLGRNFNWAPASARGFNGNETAGPFMIEVIGDFDDDAETISKKQLASTLAVIKVVQTRFKLRPQDLRFHNEMSVKTCPGGAFDKKSDFIRKVRDCALPNSPADGRSSRGSRDAPFSVRAGRVWEVLQSLKPGEAQTDDMSHAEHGGGLDALSERARGGLFGGGELTDDMIEALTDHVVNLERGKFSDSGRVETTKGDIDRLFEEVLPKEIAAAKAKGEKAKLLFYAHGGLVSETNALLGAFNQLKFWRDNGVYPVFFVWETGFAETIRQLVSAAFGLSRGRRGWITDLTDEAIEELVRFGQGGFVWGGMKSSAALASAPSGGARYVAKSTLALLKKHKNDLEIHTVGHSAGSIFNAHFMHALARRNVTVKTAQFLAPAIRNDLFHDLVAPHLGDEIGPLTIFTMRKNLERDDNVALAYRKSLLYLIYEALEPKRQTDILGLEISLRKDKKAAKIFGLNANPSTANEVVWSKSDAAASGSASKSTTHGGFDDDKATMESAARRILDKRDGQPIAPFEPQVSRSRGDFWSSQLELPPHLEGFRQSLLAGPFPVAPIGVDGAAPSPTAGQSVVGGGQRKALCIGIDDYPRSPLGGCVADARLWRQTLQSLGFHVDLMTDHQATAAAIRGRVKALIADARPGDHIVLQYAGHGTQFIDRDGDEASGDTPARDECLCAIDCDSGDDGLVIDDELKLIFADLAEGAALTVFFDCCHSGSATRATLRARGRGGDVRARFLEPSSHMLAAYNKAREAMQARGAKPGTLQRDVLFSACKSDELAFESNGQGDFTLRATGVIEQGTTGLSNLDVYEKVLQAFGDHRRQTPELHVYENLALRNAPFLGR